MIEFEEQENRAEINMIKYNDVFVDVDSCLCGVEGIDLLGLIHGVGEEVAAYTKEAMDGGVPMEEVFGKRLEIIQPEAMDLVKVAHAYRKAMTPHARNALQSLRGVGVNVRLLSGGYDGAINPLARELGIPLENVHANKLYFDYEGKYAGFDMRIPLWRTGGKKRIIEDLRRERVIWGPTAIIGDSVSELETKPATDFRIGFGGHVRRDRVVEEADVFLNENTFAPLLPLLIDRYTIDHILLFRPELRQALREGFDAIGGVTFNYQARNLMQRMNYVIGDIPIEKFDPDIPAVKENDG